MFILYDAITGELICYMFAYQNEQGDEFIFNVSLN